MTDREKSGSVLPASTGPSLGGGPDTTVFVWGIWSVAVVYALLLAYRGRKFPFTDDWLLLPIVGGEPYADIYGGYHDTGLPRVHAGSQPVITSG